MFNSCTTRTDALRCDGIHPRPLRVICSQVFDLLRTQDDARKCRLAVGKLGSQGRWRLSRCSIRIPSDLAAAPALPLVFHLVATKQKLGGIPTQKICPCCLRDPKVHLVEASSLESKPTPRHRAGCAGWNMAAWPERLQRTRDAGASRRWWKAVVGRRSGTQCRRHVIYSWGVKRHRFNPSLAGDWYVARIGWRKC